MVIDAKEQESLKEYYIAYMDLLGYKEFFNENPESTMEFYEQIKSAIHETKKILKSTKQPLKYKIFSDNIIIFLEAVEDKENDISNLLMLMLSVANIQRHFILEHNLFLRGSITKGTMCVNREFLFGAGLIEAVEIEENKAIYPRIVVSNKIAELISGYKGVDEVTLKKIEVLSNKIRNKVKLTDGEKLFFKYYTAVLFIDAFVKHVQYFLIYEWGGVYVLNYLDNIEKHILINKDDASELIKLLSVDYDDERMQSNPYLEEDLAKHKKRIEAKLKKYAGEPTTSPDFEREAIREHILKKYIWSCFYHNSICEMYGLNNLKIKGEVQLDEISLNIQYRFDKRLYYGIQPGGKK